MPRRQYTQEDKATTLAILKACGGELSKAARESGVPRNTIRGWMIEPSRAAPIDLRQTKEADLAARWSEVRDLAIIRAKEQLEAGGKLGLRDLTILAGVGTDKVNLLTGKSTDRIEVTNLADFLRTQSGTHQAVSMPAAGQPFPNGTRLLPN